MKWLNGYRMKLALAGCVIAQFALNPVSIQAQDGRPIADAGSSRYAGPDPIVLDGTRSYDPDSSGSLSYTWRQISGPSVVIIDANTPTPTIAGSIQPNPGRDPTPKPQGFPQTEGVQECEFELVVSDGELASVPDIVKVIIVPELRHHERDKIEKTLFLRHQARFWFVEAKNVVLGNDNIFHL